MRGEHGEALPGEGMPYANLYELRVDQGGGGTKGVKDPSGKFHTLAEGEEFALLRVEGVDGRIPVIKKNGRTILFEEWASRSGGHMS